MAVNPVAASPELESAVARARRRAATAGELPPRHAERQRESLPAEIRAFLRQILEDGSYAEAVARIGTEDPELADQ